MSKRFVKGDCPKDKIYIPDKDDSECSKFHAVAIVGYTESESDDGTALVKNSWGTSWGCNGFINYALTPRSRILEGVSFPKVSRRRSGARVSSLKKHTFWMKSILFTKKYTFQCVSSFCKK